MHIGPRLRQLRHERNLTLKELSRRTGVAMATLCRIERNKMRGSLKSHVKICKAISVTLPELYSAPHQVSLVKPMKPPASYSYLGNENVSFEILTSEVSSRKMMPTLIKIRPGFSTPAAQSGLDVEKLIYVISGEVEINVGGEVFLLHNGDNFYLSGAKAHSFKNRSNADSSLLCIVSPPG